MKWYNVELSYNTKTAIKRAENFKLWLYENGYKHETSACGDMVHIEVYASPKNLDAINNALDKIVWFDAIYAM